MSIERVIVKNYRALASAEINLRPDLNIIVGDNESGKSTLLEAINLALKCQINRRPAPYELHPFLFNMGCVAQYLDALKRREGVQPPEIMVELYFTDCDALAELKGTNNSEGENRPGISITIRLDDENYKTEYQNYIADPTDVRSIPVEYYEVVWQTFAGERIKPRTIPVRSSLIDPSAISDTYAAGRYVVEFTRDYLSDKEQVDLALSYRKMRDAFRCDASITRINAGLAKEKGMVSDKTLSVAMDMTARAGWESAVLPHLDEIPITLAGKGEQSSVKIKLALKAVKSAEIVLIEEPENHLSHTNLNRLIAHLSAAASDKQLIIATHSSFVLNKLGIEHILLFNGKTNISINNLSPDTAAYFKRLPGHDTLRLILARCTILVEGPSDELIVQKAFRQKYNVLPIEAGVEVISVYSLAFKRFLEIAKPLNIDTRVVTDNDGRVEAVIEKYKDYVDDKNIRICFSKDNNLKTLEMHIVLLNDLNKLNRILCASFRTTDDLLEYMLGNKTEYALKIFESEETIAVPDYIEDAIK
ncbi:MAG TPA: AAA family ATPase [Terracidiphilus sp.]|jgi:ABC-type lipoprotein export system ATPase subunit